MLILTDETDDKEKSYKAKLYEIVDKTYENHPKHDGFMKFRVYYEKKAPKSFGAQYDPMTRTIRMLLNNVNYQELLMSVLIHEVAHHVQYIDQGYSGHDKFFRQYQKEMLFTALDLGYVDLQRLYAYYEWLSSYQEKNIVKKMLYEYLSAHKEKYANDPVFFNAYVNLPYDRDKVLYLKDYRFLFFPSKQNRNKYWWKFENHMLQNELNASDILSVNMYRYIIDAHSPKGKRMG